MLGGFSRHDKLNPMAEYKDDQNTYTHTQPLSSAVPAEDAPIDTTFLLGVGLAATMVVE